MAIDFDDVKETIRVIALRLDSPSSKYNFIFSESDHAVEVCVEDSTSTDSLFVFVVDEERFRVLKSLEIDPEGYASFPYHSYVELLSFVVQYFYPVFFRLSNYGTVVDMLTRILGKSIRVWKDLLRVICEVGQVEFTDRGKVFNVLDTNFWYNSGSQVLSVSGILNDSYKCPSVMELVTTLLTILAYIFQRNDLEINPILGTQLVEDASNSLFEAEMDMGNDIDSMDMNGVFDDGGGVGEDLSAEFTPAGDSVENTAPDVAEGKEEIMDEVMTAVHRVPKGFKSIFSNVGKGAGIQVDKVSSVSSYTPLYSDRRRGIFSAPDQSYAIATNDMRHWLDELCLKIKHNLETQGKQQVAFSPVTNLIWKVTVGKDVYFEVVVSPLKKTGYRMDYNYISLNGRRKIGYTSKMGDLKEIVLRRGVWCGSSG